MVPEEHLGLAASSPAAIFAGALIGKLPTRFGTALSALRISQNQAAVGNLILLEQP
jgi:hypothetical protein